MKSTFCLKVTNPSTIAQRRDIGGYDDGGGDHDEGVNTNSHIYITQAARARKGEKEDSEQRKKNDQKQKIRQRERERDGVGWGRRRAVSLPTPNANKFPPTSEKQPAELVGMVAGWLVGLLVVVDGKQQLLTFSDELQNYYSPAEEKNQTQTQKKII